MRFFRVLIVLILTIVVISGNRMIGTATRNLASLLFVKNCGTQTIEMSRLQVANCKVSPLTFSYLSRAVDLGPESSSTLRMLAEAFYAQQSWAQAEELYQRAVNLEPDDPINRLELGSFYYSIGEKEKAIGEWQHIEVAPLFLSEIIDYWNDSNLVGALELYEVLTLLDDSIIPLRLRIDVGWTYYELGRKSKALSQFVVALKQSAKETTYLQSIANGELGIFFARENQCGEDAVNYLTEASRLAEEPPIYQVWLGACLREQKKYDLAERELLIATRSNDDNVRSLALLRLGQLYILQDRPDEAIRILENACFLLSDSIECYSALADAYWGSDRLEDALAQYELILKLDPNNETYQTRYLEIQSLLNK